MKDWLAFCVIVGYFLVMVGLTGAGVTSLVPKGDALEFLKNFNTFTAPFVGMVFGHYFFQPKDK